MVARQAWRFVERLPAEVEHWPRTTMRQVQAESTVARQAWRFVARRRSRAQARHWPRAATHQAERDSPGSLDLVALARLLPRPERLFRCWPNQDPFAFYPATPADRKCNRAGRCGGHPILRADLERRREADRYRKRRNRRGPVRCDNRSNRSRRKCAGHAQPFQISASDKYRCLLRRFADRDDQSANRECKRAQARKRQASREFREREERNLSSVCDHLSRFRIHRIQKCRHAGGAAKT